MLIVNTILKREYQKLIKGPNFQLEAHDQIEIHLLKSGKHFLYGDITEENTSRAAQWITYENLDEASWSSKKPITLFINSPGGNLYDAFALIDAMKASHRPVATVGLGSVMSAAFLIFTAGAKRLRYIGPNCGIMCHEFSETIEGKHHDIKASLLEGNHCDQKMMNILKDATGLDEKIIKKRLLNETDQWLTPAEAIELKIADRLFTKF